MQPYVDHYEIPPDGAWCHWWCSSHIIDIHTGVYVYVTYERDQTCTQHRPSWAPTYYIVICSLNTTPRLWTYFAAGCNSHQWSQKEKQAPMHEYLKHASLTSLSETLHFPSNPYQRCKSGCHQHRYDISSHMLPDDICHWCGRIHGLEDRGHHRALGHAHQTEVCKAPK